MSLAKRFALSLYWNLIGKIFLSAIGFFISIVIARELGTENLGIFASLLTIPVVLRLSTSFGFETIINLKLPALNSIKGGKRKIRYLLKRLLLLRLFIIISVILIVNYGSPLLASILKKPEIIKYSNYLSFYFAALVSVSLISIIFRALLQLKIVSYLDGLNQVMNLILILLFFHMGYKLSGIFLAFIISTTTVIIIYAFLSKDFFIGKSDPVEMKESYQVGAVAFISSLIVFGLGNQIDILFLNFFGVNNSQIGFYYLSLSLMGIFSFLITGTGSIAQSVFSETYEKNHINGLKSSWESVVKVCIFLSLPAYVFALLYASPIIKALYGNQYLGAVFIFQIFAFFAFARMIFGAVLQGPIFYIIKRKRVYLTIIFFGGILNIILDIILIPVMGVEGAAIATGLSTFITALSQLIYLFRFIKIQTPVKYDIKIFFICLLSLIPTLGWGNEDLYSLVLKGLVYVLSLIFFMAIIKPLDDEERYILKDIDYRLYAIARYF